MRANRSIQTLIAKLAERGVQMRTSWSAKRSPSSRYDDVFGVSFTGSDSRPRIGSAVIVDHGEGDGYSIFLAAETSMIDSDVNAIMGWGAEAPTA